MKKLILYWYYYFSCGENFYGFSMSVFAVHIGISIRWMWMMMLSYLSSISRFLFSYISSCNRCFQILCSSIYDSRASIVHSKKPLVRLNLINQVLALFHAKFACISAIKYPIFRWKLCKSSVWEDVKKTQVVCNSKESRDWISQLASCQNATRVNHAGWAKGS